MNMADETAKDACDDRSTSGTRDKKETRALFSRHIRSYYEHYFPFEALYAWATSGGDRDDDMPAHLREVAFCWLPEIMSRWRALPSDATQWRATVLKSTPHRIELGGIYDVPIGERALLGPGSHSVVARELVFDIDIDAETDRYRTCCTDANYCTRCWPLINSTMSLVDLLLRRVYAFKSLLWVFSGRRGVHCWVRDRRARHMSGEARAELLERFDDIRRSADAANADNYPLPQYSAALVAEVRSLLRQAFDRYLESQPKLFHDPTSRNKTSGANCTDAVNKSVAERLIEIAHDEGRQNASMGEAMRTVVSTMRRQTDAANLVGALLQVIEKSTGSHTQRERVHDRLAATFCFQPLDKHVTSDMNHLLKLPFCVHPSTGNVCVPIAADCLATFYPRAEFVPTISLLCESSQAGSMNDEQKQARASHEKAIGLLRAQTSES